MSATTFDSYSDSVEDEIVPYRAIHAGAIVGVVLGLLSVFVLISAASSFEACLLITPIPILGMFVALRSWGRIQREPDQYTGSKLAMAGFALSLLFLGHRRQLWLLRLRLGSARRLRPHLLRNTQAG